MVFVHGQLSIFKWSDVFTMCGSKSCTCFNKTKKLFGGKNCLTERTDPFGMNRLKDPFSQLKTKVNLSIM